MEADKWKAGRQANRQEQCFRGIQSLGLLSVLHFNPWQKCSFKIHLNVSGKQLFWYPNCNDTCIFLCREYVIILFKAICFYLSNAQSNVRNSLNNYCC